MEEDRASPGESWRSSSSPDDRCPGHVCFYKPNPIRTGPKGLTGARSVVENRQTRWGTGDGARCRICGGARHSPAGRAGTRSTMMGLQCGHDLYRGQRGPRPSRQRRHGPDTGGGRLLGSITGWWRGPDRRADRRGFGHQQRRPAYISRKISGLLAWPGKQPRRNHRNAIQLPQAQMCSRRWPQDFSIFCRSTLNEYGNTTRLGSSTISPIPQRAENCLVYVGPEFDGQNQAGGKNQRSSALAQI